MATYQEVAENLIRLYAHYVEVCTANEESYDDFSDDLVIAVEALLIRADEGRRKALEMEAITQLQSYTGSEIEKAIQSEFDYPLGGN